MTTYELIKKLIESDAPHIAVVFDESEKGWHYMIHLRLTLSGYLVEDKKGKSRLYRKTPSRQQPQGRNDVNYNKKHNEIISRRQ